MLRGKCLCFVAPRPAIATLRLPRFGNAAILVRTACRAAKGGQVSAPPAITPILESPAHSRIACRCDACRMAAVATKQRPRSAMLSASGSGT